MKKILFLIHDLGHGGAEKVLVNLVNNMDHEKFDVTVMALFGGGVNEQFLSEKIRYQTVYKQTIPGNSHVMKVFTPKQLHDMYIKETYDIEIAYLEGPAVRIISGCSNPKTKLVYWIHCTMHSEKEFAGSFRSISEARKCLEKFEGNVFVSKEVMKAFKKFCVVPNGIVLYNTNDSNKIIEKAAESLEDERFLVEGIKLIGVGKIEKVKGFDRLAKVHKRLIKEGFQISTFILGEGSKKADILKYLKEEQIEQNFIFLGYQTNPYKYIKNSDIFICSSYSEGFSTAATEALIVETPVVTTLVSGMKELLGENNEWGIVTQNDEESLYRGIKYLLETPEYLNEYKRRAVLRGKDFKTEKTVQAVQEFFEKL